MFLNPLVGRLPCHAAPRRVVFACMLSRAGPVFLLVCYTRVVVWVVQEATMRLLERGPLLGAVLVRA